MTTYLIRRVLWLIPVLFAVTLITFVLMHLVPGGPWNSERPVSPGLQRVIDEQFGLNKPIYEQYFMWLGNLLRGDLGPSFRYSGVTINTIFGRGLPITVQLGVMSFIVAVGLGIPLGILGALGHNRWPDYVTTTISIIGIATPSFVLAILLILIFSVALNWFPAIGWKGPNTWVLPTVALAGYSIAQIARYTRAAMLEVTRKDYVRTAQSKGIRNRAVVVRHMIRNAMIPVVTILGPVLANLVTGSFIIENFFGVPGVGRYYVQGIQGRDYGMIMASTLLYAFAVAALNVVVDILYAYIDPRIRYS